ncbi:MAG: DUF1934 domain-containing protein [Bacillota bacterium]
MKKKVSITVENIQTGGEKGTGRSIRGKEGSLNGGKKQEAVFLEEEAVLHRKNGKYYLIYQDFSEGLSGARTVIKADPEKQEMTLLRHKPAEMQQTFVAGERKKGRYALKTGRLELETETRTLHLDLGLTRGFVEVEYRVFLNGSPVSRNKLQINYIQKENDDRGK